MIKENFAERIKKIMGEKAPAEKTNGTWNGKIYRHIYKKLEDNFIDGKYPKYCDIKGNLAGEGKKIKYHKDAKHLNSSQVLCINFFKKFFENEKWEIYLLKALSAGGVNVSDRKILNAIFEYEPCTDERTNFDFYMVLDNGSHISMEIKYTESKFGGIKKDKKDPNKYQKKWKQIYKEMVRNCPFVLCRKKKFYSNYQINRNIVYANENDIVLFLIPKANDFAGIRKGRKYIDRLNKKYPQIKKLYWEDLVKELLNIIDDEKELKEYYEKFREKYIDILRK